MVQQARRTQRLVPPLRHVATRTTTTQGGEARLDVICGLVSATAIAHLLWPRWVPIAGLIPWVVIGAVFLTLPRLRVLYTVTVFWLAVAVMIEWADSPYHEGAVVVATMLMMYPVSVSRSRHGVHGLGGDRMLSDLRDELSHLGEIPSLPPGWRAERAIATAHDQAFSGDFNVTVLDEDERILQLLLTDVSGKGQRAGTRALVLSGAMTGVMGGGEPGAVLAAANAYLARYGGREGFATAVHLVVDLVDGAFEVGTAGHIPAMYYDAGRGRWSALDGARGPALGFVEHAHYERVSGVLGRGDAILICTDGVVESRRMRIEDGIDWMLGRAEARMAAGFSGLVADLVSDGRAGAEDDRAAILLWRE
ncbi:PP2C family protein-serine/threonine phosphatase [Janibacter sp. GXQ6167]|uniref:PP2C family protein-serine/threonine phosphatase n=1 Tax=Janibacter sp. GXQ6167 TaxID=3240791 RepID=UPI0035267CB4